MLDIPVIPTPFSFFHAEIWEVASKEWALCRIGGLSDCEPFIYSISEYGPYPAINEAVFNR